MRALVLLLAALALAAPLALAQNRAPACTWETAEAISVAALERSGAHHRGRCVRVRGLTDGWAMRSRERRGAVGEEIFIGAYVDDEALGRELRRRPRRVEALGVVGHCRDICAEENELLDVAGAAGSRREMAAARAEGRAPESLVICMASGYCHYYDDAYLRIQAVR